MVNSRVIELLVLDTDVMDPVRDDGYNPHSDRYVFLPSKHPGSPNNL